MRRTATGNTLDDIWHRFCPGTKGEFARFMGTTVKAMQTITWDKVSKIAWRRFQMPSLGGSCRFSDTKLEEFAFAFRQPARGRWWSKGVPGRAWIDGIGDQHERSTGRGPTLDHAALGAMLSLWELTYRRAQHQEHQEP